MTRVLAVASGGGHWEQLMLLRPALDDNDTTFATTNPDLIARAQIAHSALLADCNRDQPIKSLIGFCKSIALVRRLRPQVILSTGAAPGLLCILAGRLFGARTLWIDSVANAERLSLSGKMARFCAHECFTQWEHLAAANGPRYAGAVL